MGDQTRYQRWEAGLLATPDLIGERDLDICLMKQTNRSIYREGYIRFENLMYQGEHLAGYAGERVVLRYDPRDITSVLVYQPQKEKEVFLARAYATELETEQVSLEEVKASNQKIREKGKTISNHSVLEEVRSRDIFVAKKKTKKERQKEEQKQLHSVVPQSKPLEVEPEPEIEDTPVPKKKPRVLNYDQLKEDYGW
jgi:putative transposase